MNIGNQFKQKHVYVASIPFTDLSQVKVRPVLVVSNDGYNVSHEDVIIAAVTSSSSGSHNYAIEIDTSDLSGGYLQKPSKILPDKIFLLSKKLIKKEVFEIGKHNFFETIASIMKIINRDGHLDTFLN